MSDYGFPWDSENIGTEEKPILDRAYEAEQLQGVFKRFFSNGVFLDSEDAFQIDYDINESGNRTNVRVKGGWCHINGVFKHFLDDTPITVEPLDNPFIHTARTDAVVLRWDAVARDIVIEVKKGVQVDDAVSQPPALVRNELVWELMVAELVHGMGGFAIVDDRTSPTDCGIVAPFMQIDTSSLFQELQNAMDSTVEAYQEAIDGTLAGNLETQLSKTPQAGFEGTLGDRTYFASQKKDEDEKIYSIIATSGGELIFRKQKPNEPVDDKWRMNCKTLSGIRSGRQSVSFSTGESEKTVKVNVTGLKTTSVVTVSTIGGYPENNPVSILRVENGSFTAVVGSNLPDNDSTTLSWIAVI